MAYVDKINKENVDYDIQDSKAARSVDGTTASHVEMTNQIYTTSTQSTTASFIYRTTAGDVSIETGEATLQYIDGNTVQTGHTDEVLEATGEFVESVTVTLDKSTFRTKVTTNGVYVFTYGVYGGASGWGLNGSLVDLAEYGLSTSGGQLTTGDTITVNYTKLVVGSLDTATPTNFVATGFNQYDATAGYAHVKGDNQYRIAGTYTSLGFTTTIGGTTTAVTVTNGKFTPAEDGYIYVTGASGDILIALVWSGTMDSEPYSTYSTSTIAIPTKDASNNDLPTATYGMPSVHGVADRLSFADKAYIQKIGHYTYSAENLATVEALDTDYWYDGSDIFYVLDTPVTYTLADSLSGAYTANDYGTEEFTGTSVELTVSIVYGNSLVDKLRNMLPIQSIGTGLTLTGTELSASGGGDTVYSTKTTSNQSDGGAVFIGPLNSSQQELADPTTTDNHYRYFWAMPFDVAGQDNFGTPQNESINIGGKKTGANSVSVGYRNRAEDSNSVVLGWQSTSSGYGNNIVMGNGATSYYSSSIAIGRGSQTGANSSTAIGAYAKTTRVGEINVGSTSSSYGFNSTNYRVIGGVHDGQDAHDAATLAQGNTLASSAPTTSTVGVLGQLYTDTTGMHTYQCTAISGNTYTWTQRW